MQSRMGCRRARIACFLGQRPSRGSVRKANDSPRTHGTNLSRPCSQEGRAVAGSGPSSVSTCSDLSAPIRIRTPLVLSCTPTCQTRRFRTWRSFRVSVPKQRKASIKSGTTQPVMFRREMMELVTRNRKNRVQPNRAGASTGARARRAVEPQTRGGGLAGDKG